MRKIIFTLILLWGIVCPALSINYDKEFSKIDTLMNKSMLRDADTLLKRVEKESVKENNTREMLRSEIYSFAIDMGCVYSPKSGLGLMFSYDNKQEGLEIINRHYTKTKNLLPIISDDVEISVCQYFLFMLALEYNKVNKTNVTSEIKENYESLPLEEMSSNEISLTAQKYFYQLLNAFDKIGMTKTSLYPQLFINLDNEDCYVIDLIGNNLVESTFFLPDSKERKKINPISSQLEVSKKDNAQDVVYTQLVKSFMKHGCDSLVIAYDLRRIKNLKNFDSDEDIINALDALIQKYPNNPEIVKAEYLRAELIYKKFEDKPISYKDKEQLSELMDRINDIKNRFNDIRLTDCLNEISDWLNQHILYAKVKNAIHSGESVKLIVKNANIDKIKVKIYKTTTPAYTYFSSPEKVRYNRRKRTETFELSKSDYRYLAQDTFDLGTFDYGAYRIEIYDIDNHSVDTRIHFRVTDLAVMHDMLIYNNIYDFDRLGDPSQYTDEEYIPNVSDFDIDEEVFKNDSDIIVHKFNIYALDSKSGKPIEGAKVKPTFLHDYNYSVDENIQSCNVIDKTGTDKNGKTIVSVLDDQNVLIYYDESFARCYLTKGKDQYSAYCSLYPQEIDKSTKSFIKIFTDRAVYRPGQTVHYFGVRYTNSALGDTVQSNKKTYIEIEKGYGKTILTDSTTTDKFGKFYGEFKIPNDENAIGRYNICTSDNIKKYYTRDFQFNVEAYKLQQAEIEFYPLNDKNTLKENVEIKDVARYLSGQPVANIPVSVEIDDTESVVTTDSIGEFSIVYHPDTTQRSKNINLNASLTTPSGETIIKNQSIKLRKDNIFLSLKINNEDKDEICYDYYSLVHEGKIMDIKRDKLIFNCTNKYDYNESPTPLRRDVKLSFHNEKDSVVYSGIYTLDGITSVDVPKIANGKYRIIAIDKEDADTLAIWNSILFHPDSTTTPCDIPFWASKNTDNYQLGEKDSFEVSLGIGVDDAYVLYRIYNNYGFPLKEEWLNLHKGLKTIKIPYDELFSNKYRLGAIVTFNMYYDGVAYSRTYCIEKKKDPKTMNVKISSLRDHIDAGSHQKWTIETDSINLPSSIAVTMTDAALDTYKPNSWSYRLSTFQPDFNAGSYTSHIFYDIKDVSSIIPPYAEYNELEQLYSIMLCGESLQSIDRKTIGEYTSGDFKDGVVVKGIVRDSEEPLPFANVVVKGTTIGTNTDMDGHYSIIVPLGSILEFSYSGYETKEYKIRGNRELNVELDVVFLEELVVTGYGVQKRIDWTDAFSGVSEKRKEKEDIKIEDVVSKTPYQQHKLRSNFSECAFFFPNVETKDGKATIEFDAPESLTRWNIKLFANTKDLHSGYAHQTVCTSAPFMARPLMPRILRSGDEQTITVSVINHENESVKGKASLIVEDTITKKEICKIIKDFDVASKETQAIDFSFDVPDGINAVKITAIAESDKYSDGEVYSLNVVSNRSKVIKANSAMIRNGEEKVLCVNTDEGKNIDLTFEYSPNAIWQAIMAMPSDKDLDDDNAFDLASSIYLNSLARSISINHPEIKNVVDKWMSDSSVANSPLYNHPNINDVSLDATPWIYSAQEESERRIQVSNMLDTGRAKNKIQESLDKLFKLQKNDGGFSWWSDGNSSEWTTLYVAMTINRLRNTNDNIGINYLNKYGKYGVRYLEKFKNALSYIDDCIHNNLKYYQLRKTNNNSYDLSTSEFDLRELHLRLSTQDILPISKQSQTAVNVYLNDVAKNWKGLTLYGKACMTRCLIAAKKDSLAKVIATSIYQTYTKDPSQGIYWKENVDNCSWHNNSIAVHAEAMRALKEAGMVSDEEFAEMQLWLLYKRESTSWRSLTDAIDAINILINTSSTSISNGIVTMPDGEMINSESAYSGYIRRSMKGNVGKNSVKIKGASEGIGFAALLASYNSKNDLITAASNHISISKKTFIVKRDSIKGEILAEVKPNDVLNIGDELRVELTVHNDQDLDYVCIQDVHATCLEPEKLLTQYIYNGSSSYYRSITDKGVRLYFDRLSKGNFKYSYKLHVANKGIYSPGISTAECLYSPSFRGNSDSGEKLKVK